MEKVLIIGATGATGKLALLDLLKRNYQVTAIVRPSSSLAIELAAYSNYSEVKAEIAQMSVEDLTPHLVNCHTVLCCLGHTLSFRSRCFCNFCNLRFLTFRCLRVFARLGAHFLNQHFLSQGSTCVCVCVSLCQEDGSKKTKHTENYQQHGKQNVVNDRLRV